MTNQDPKPVLPTPWELLRLAHNKDEFMVAMRDLIRQERAITTKAIEEALSAARSYTDIRISGQPKLIDDCISKHAATCEFTAAQRLCQPVAAQGSGHGIIPAREVLKGCVVCGRMVKESEFHKNQIGNITTICQDCDDRRNKIKELKAELIRLNSEIQVSPTLYQDHEIYVKEKAEKIREQDKLMAIAYNESLKKENAARSSYQHPRVNCFAVELGAWRRFEKIILAYLRTHRECTAKDIFDQRSGPAKGCSIGTTRFALRFGARTGVLTMESRRIGSQTVNFFSLKKEAKS